MFNLIVLGFIIGVLIGSLKLILICLCCMNFVKCNRIGCYFIFLNLGGYDR